jgi:hypothetical protein
MRGKIMIVAALLAFGLGTALAGAGGAPPGGGGANGGSGGSEPALWFLMLLSLVPGVWFARKALAARKTA